MNKILIQVEEFDLAAIKAAFREGRLYMRKAVKSEAQIREDGIRAIMDYVSRIDDCASVEFYAHIRDVWCAVLNDEQLQPLFFLDRYLSSRGKVNWYRVNVFICLLREMHVYQCERYTGVELHLLCEQATHRNTHYTCMNRYLLEHKEMMYVRKLIKQFKSL